MTSARNFTDDAAVQEDPRAAAVTPRPVVARLPKYAAGKPPAVIEGLQPTSSPPTRTRCRRCPRCWPRSTPSTTSTATRTRCAPRCAPNWAASWTSRPTTSSRCRQPGCAGPDPADLRRADDGRHRGRGRLRLAVLRGLPDRGRTPPARDVQVPLTAGRPPRPRGHGGRRHRAHPRRSCCARPTTRPARC